MISVMTETITADDRLASFPNGYHGLYPDVSVSSQLLMKNRSRNRSMIRKAVY